MRVGSLFSGIGGFELAAQWCGHETIWQSEIDPYCVALLAERFPKAKQLGDITRIDWSTVERPDIITGGFPCQPHSVASTASKGGGPGRLGIADARWLWPQYRGAIAALRPRYAVVENVRGILTSSAGRAFLEILDDLASLGYDAEWDCLSASQVGAAHQRERIWLLAYAGGTRREGSFADYGVLGCEEAALTLPSDYAAIEGLSLDARFASLRDGNGVSVAMERRRLHALGNAIVPACALPIFARIEEIERSLSPETR